MTTNKQEPANSRFLALNNRPKGRRFIIVYDWMFQLDLPTAVVCTLATVCSFQYVNMKVSAAEIGRFLSKDERTIRRHFRAIARAGLWVPKARYRPRGTRLQRAENEYEFLWRAPMPESLRGPIYEGGRVARVRAKPDVRDMGAPVRQHGSALSPTSPLLKTAEEIYQQASKSDLHDADLLPPDLRAALEKAAPGQVDDCLRVLRSACEGLDRARARSVQVIALRKLIERCERAEVSNAPGLLRACLIGEAMSEAESRGTACEALRAEIERRDQSLPRMRSGFEILRYMRKRELDLGMYGSLHVAAFGAEPQRVPAFSSEDPAFAELLNGVAKTLTLARAARERDDALSVNKSQEALHRLERELDRLIGKRAGAVS